MSNWAFGYAAAALVISCTTGSFWMPYSILVPISGLVVLWLAS